MKKLLFFALVALVVSSCCSKFKYETVKGDPLKARIYTLDNGLKVYMTVNKEEPRVQTYIAVRVGGKNDPEETTGLAHYFEHLMFKGSENFGTSNYEAEKPLLEEIESLFEVYRKTTDEARRAKIYRAIDSISYKASKFAIPNEYDKLMAVIGARGTNAYTTQDETVYMDNIPANQMENWVKIQADRFENFVVRGFHTELETIYEEKNMSLTNDSRKLAAQIMLSLYPNHPYGTQAVLGSQQHLKNPSITNVKNYHAQWYVPNNMAICLSGDLDPEKTMEIIDKYFGAMKSNPELPEAKHSELPEIPAPIVKEVTGLDAETIAIAWRAPGAVAGNTSDLMSIVSAILYNSKAGLLDLDLNQAQEVLSSSAGYTRMTDHGVLVMQGRPKAGQTLDRVRELLMAEMAKLRGGEFDEGLIEASINNFKAARMYTLDTNDGRVDAFVSAFISGAEWSDEVEQLDRISRITKDDVVNFARENFTDSNCVVIYKRVGKDPTLQKIAKPAITPIMTNRDVASEFLSSIAAARVKPIEPVFLDFDKDMRRLEAEKGTEVLYKKNETTDLFTLIYLYETGSNNDPVINTAADYIQYLGTDEMSAEELSAEFFDIACSMDINAGEERTYITISGLSENMARAMELAENLLGNAVADEKILAGLKTDIAKSRADAKLNQMRNFGRLRVYATRGPEFIAAKTLSDDELAAVTSEQLLAKIRALAGMQHRILYYGPQKPSSLLKSLSAHHRTAETLAPCAENVKYPYVETPENSVVIAEYDAPQIYFFQYSNRGETYDPAQEAIVALYNNYFGGGMYSIVFQEMREARSLAYSSSAWMGTPARLDQPYSYNAFIATQNDKMPEAISAFEQIINHMPESGAAFDLAKESLVANLRTERIIKENVLWSWIAACDLGLDYDTRREVYETLPTLTLDDVTEFQRKRVADRNYTYCILGRSDDLDMGYLEKLGPVRRVTKEDIFGY